MADTPRRPQLPPANPGILDTVEPAREVPMYVYLAVGTVCVLMLYAVVSWLLGAH